MCWPTGRRILAPIRIIHHPRQRIVPRQKRRQKAKESAGFDDGWVRRVLIVAMEVPDAEEHECEVEGEKEAEECDRRPQGDQEEDGGEDEPTLGRGSASDAATNRDELTIKKKPKES